MCTGVEDATPPPTLTAVITVSADDADDGSDTETVASSSAVSICSFMFYGGTQAVNA